MTRTTRRDTRMPLRTMMRASTRSARHMMAQKDCRFAVSPTTFSPTSPLSISRTRTRSTTFPRLFSGSTKVALPRLLVLTPLSHCLALKRQRAGAPDGLSSPTYEAARAQGTPIAVSPVERRAVEQKLGLGRAYSPIDESLLHVPTEEDIRIVKAKDKRHDKGRCVAKEKKTPAATSDAGPSN